MFDRINTGSKIANKAEVRRGALVGPFLDLVIELAKEPAFEKLAPVPEKDRKLREREELVTRFFAFSDGLEGYKDKVSPFLFEYAKKMTAHFVSHPDDVPKYRERFLETMAFIRRVFPHGFRRARNGKATPRARFEAIAIGSYLALQHRPELASQQIDVSAWLKSEEFLEVTGSDGANVIKKLTNRLHFVRDRLLETEWPTH